MNQINSDSDTIAGVVLIGGKSSRMGKDKALLEINNQPLYKIAVKKLLPFCNQVYLSVNKNQNSENTYEYPTIIDQYESQGPIGALLSCMNEIDDSPLLVLGCDMPFLTDKEINLLLSNRNRNQICTTFYNAQSNIYEPMLSIWESHARHVLESYFKAGHLSLQKFLRQQDIHKINTPEESNFSNINYPEEWKTIM